MRLPSALSAAAQRSFTLIGRILMAEDSAVKPEIQKKGRLKISNMGRSMWMRRRGFTQHSLRWKDPKKALRHRTMNFNVASLSFLSVGGNGSPMVIESPHALHQKAREEAWTFFRSQAVLSRNSYEGHYVGRLADW